MKMMKSFFKCLITLQDALKSGKKLLPDAVCQNLESLKSSKFKTIHEKEAALEKSIVGSTPKSVDFNERRRIGQGPSIDNFQSFYSRRLGVVLASSCGGSPR